MKLRLIVLLLAAFALSGCYAQDTILRMNGNGTGTIEVHVGINKAYDALVADPEDQGESPNVESIVTTVELTAEDFPPAWQSKVTPWDDGTYQGAKLVVQFTDSGMMQEQLNRLLEEAKGNGYSDTIVSIASQAQQGRVQIKTSLVGVVIDDGGEPLPSGPPGTGRVLWTVVLPNVDTCETKRFASCTSNQAEWNIPFNSLQPDETIELLAAGQLSAAAPSTNSPTTAPATPTTAVPTTTASATPIPPTAQPPTSTSTAISATAVAATIAPTVPPTGANTPTRTPQAPSTLTAATPAPQATTAQEGGSGAAVTAQPAAEASPTRIPVANAQLATAPPAQVGPSSVPPVTANPPSSQATTSSPIAAAVLPTEQAYAPIVGDASEPNNPVSAVATAPAQARSRRPVLPYRNAGIVVCLLGAAACLGYVGARRLRQRKAADAAIMPSDDVPEL